MLKCESSLLGSPKCTPTVDISHHLDSPVVAVNICRGAPERACKEVNTAGTLHTEESKKLDELNL